MILEAPGDRVDLELMCLSINLASNKRNAQLICESKGNKTSGITKRKLIRHYKPFIPFGIGTIHFDH